MRNRNSAIALGKQIGTLFDVGALGTVSDRALLDEFLRGGESSEAAFATLVERHGTMVLRVCRHLLSDGHLAEDAFQATFLLLARRARSIQDPDAMAGWLHRVARRVALRALGEVRRRRDRERAGSFEIAVPADDRLERDELSAIVHEEIDRLGDAQRLPVLLCALEGLSHEEAAQRLRWPVGTVKSRLVRGRRRLEGRLARRGLAPAVVVAAGVAAKTGSAAHVPLALGVATTRAAMQAADVAGSTGLVSATVSLLLRKELSAMLLARVELAAVAALAACGAAAVWIGMMREGPPAQPPVAIEPPTVVAAASEEKPPIVPPADLPNVPETHGEISENPPVVPVVEQGNPIAAGPERRRSELGEQVERAIRDGIRFLKLQQQPDGSWADIDQESKTGMTSLVTLALLSAGEKPSSPSLRPALEYLRRFGPDVLNSTYAISLQTQVFAAAEPDRDQLRIAANVNWLENAQIGPNDRVNWPGSWSYSDSKRARPGDNSNTQYALLGLHAASEAWVAVKPEVWALSRAYWERTQKRDGSWAYTPDSPTSSASMTCAGVSSVIIAGRWRFQGQEYLERGETIVNCGKGGVNRNLQAGTDWLSRSFTVRQNVGNGQQWRFYYLNGLERAGRLSGVRFFGANDWYRLGAEELVHDQDRLGGFWQGVLIESNKILATSFAVQFLAKGRAPVLINKLRHLPAGDWNQDPDDVRNLVASMSRDWKHLLTWQVVDFQEATVNDLLGAPILFINGHKAPVFTPVEKTKLRDYVDRGGFILADACCGSAQFEAGFKALMKDLFPDELDALRPLAGNHPIWKSRSLLMPEIHPVWGVIRGGRTVVVYSPTDLSCYWNQAEHTPVTPAIIMAIKVGQNVVNYVTGLNVPPDKLSVP
jgi:RNA polymerase sigma factor (sigma-70 family)